MQAKIADRSLEQVIAAIQRLDLEPIKYKLMDTEEGEGWSRARADCTELAYRRFLTLLVTYPEETLAPSKDVDKFWHGHILDTLKYAEDCDRVFGRFLHHFPYFGMRGAEDAANLARAAETTKGLYRRQFGEGYERAAYCSAASTGSPAYCSAIQASDPAYCSAIQAGGPGFCAAVDAGRPAYCSAIDTDRPAYCSAVATGRLNVSLRPTL